VTILAAVALNFSSTTVAQVNYYPVSS